MTPRRSVRAQAIGVVACLALTSAASARAADLVGIDHYAVNVENLQTSADWYQKILGFHVLHKWTTTWMVGKDNIKVGLFLRPNAKPLPDIDSQFIIQHVAFLVDGDKFDGVVAELKADGLKFAPPEDTGIAFSVFIHDPDNNLLEFTTYHPPLPPPPPPPKAP